MGRKAPRKKNIEGEKFYFSNQMAALGQPTAQLIENFRFTDLSKELGQPAAQLLYKIHYWLKRDNKMWVYNTYAQWEADLQAFSRSTLQRAVKGLRAKKIIIVKRNNKRASDQVNYYSINYAILAKFLNGEINTGNKMNLFTGVKTNLSLKDTLTTSTNTHPEEIAQKKYSMEFASDAPNGSKQPNANANGFKTGPLTDEPLTADDKPLAGTAKSTLITEIDMIRTDGELCPVEFPKGERSESEKHDVSGLPPGYRIAPYTKVTPFALAQQAAQIAQGFVVDTRVLVPPNEKRQEKLERLKGTIFIEDVADALGIERDERGVWDRRKWMTSHPKQQLAFGHYPIPTEAQMLLLIPNPKDVLRFLFLNHPDGFSGDDQIYLVRAVLGLSHWKAVDWIAERFDGQAPKERKEPKMNVRDLGNSPAKNFKPMTCK